LINSILPIAGSSTQLLLSADNCFKLYIFMGLADKNRTYQHRKPAFSVFFFGGEPLYAGFFMAICVKNAIEGLFFKNLKSLIRLILYL
jgi:hypothetical protein